MGRTLSPPIHPQRIVSLVPSQTELLFYFGAPVVGITQFCIHPAEARQMAQLIGGTKQFDFAKISALEPDLIIGNKEENYQAGIEQLAQTYPVWMSDILTVADSLQMIRQVGQLVGEAEKGAQLAEETAVSLQTMPKAPTPLRVAYFIWHKPHMVAGANTFIDSVLQQLGWVNVFANQERYPTVTAQEIQAAQPELLLLSSEPFRYQEKHRLQYEAEYGVATHLVDGEAFSWYGPRLLASVPYLRQLVVSGIAHSASYAGSID